MDEKEPLTFHRAGIEVDTMMPRCRECKSEDVITDYTHGKLICSDCGLVIKDRLISDESEWRSFSGEGPKGGVDRDRIGRPSGGLLDDYGLSTEISRDDGGSELARIQSSSISSTHKTLLNAFGDLDMLGRSISLAENVISRAQELFKILHVGAMVRGFAREAVLCGCLYFACRQAKVDRTVKELCRITGSERKTAGRVISKIKRELRLKKSSTWSEQDRKEFFAPSSDTFMLRFCRLLKLSAPAISAVLDVSANIKALGTCDGQTPAVVAGAAIYLVTRLKPEDRRDARDIANVAHVADTTIKATYRKLLPHISEIVPKGYVPVSVLTQLN